MRQSEHSPENSQGTCLSGLSINELNNKPFPEANQRRPYHEVTPKNTNRIRVTFETKAKDKLHKTEI